MSSVDMLKSLFQQVPSHIERPEKGKSLIEFPGEFVAIDLETTGFSPSVDQILEFGAIRYEKGTMTDSFSSLVRYEDGSLLDDFITELTGITKEMISTAPVISDVLPKYLDFVGDSIILGHNVNFDINFIYDESVRLFNKPFTNDYIDTMRISRRLHPEEKHHRLSDLSDRYSIEKEGLHRSLFDCRSTISCYENMRDEILEKYVTFDSFIKNVSRSRSGVKASDITGDKTKEHIDCIFYNKVCVITGKLDRYTRKDAMQLIADIGGINADSVTKKTNYLILGNMDYAANIKNGKSNKLKKAEELKMAGNDIEIIPEDVFYEMIAME